MKQLEGLLHPNYGGNKGRRNPGAQAVTHVTQGDSDGNGESESQGAGPENIGEDESQQYDIKKIRHSQLPEFY